MLSVEADFDLPKVMTIIKGNLGGKPLQRNDINQLAFSKSKAIQH